MNTLFSTSVLVMTFYTCLLIELNAGQIAASLPAVRNLFRNHLSQKPQPLRRAGTPNEPVYNNVQASRHESEAEEVSETEAEGKPVPFNCQGETQELTTGLGRILCNNEGNWLASDPLKSFGIAIHPVTRRWLLS